MILLSVELVLVPNEPPQPIPNKSNNIQQVLLFFYEKATPLEQKWIVKSILRGSSRETPYSCTNFSIEYHLGVGDGQLLRKFHPDAEQQFKVCRNLQKLCQELKNPTKRVTVEDMVY